MKNLRVTVITLALLLVAISNTLAQSVGLVLSGGGARGIAHVGLIQALEDHEIPIDYVTGTSMGAIIGAFYAMGYNPSEMLELICSNEFSSWSTGEIDKNKLFYFREETPTPQMISVDLKFKSEEKGVSAHILPTSLINPIPMNLGFLYLFSPYTAQIKGDFDNLMIPYRAVASDVYGKRAVEFKSGDIGDAVRASMSFPFVFKPIEIDSTIMYDGGIYNNFPIDVMKRDFAPDIIIGSKVSDNPEKPKANDIITQIEVMVMEKTNYEIPDEDGILISYDLTEIGILDFPKAKEVYMIGYTKGEEFADSIKSRVNRRVTSESRAIQRVAFKSNTPPLIFNNLNITGCNDAERQYISKQFNSERDSTNLLDFSAAERAYYKLITDKKINDIIPHGVYNDTTGQFTLDLKTTIKDNVSLGLGAFLSSGNTNFLYLDAKYRILENYSLDVDLNGYIGRSYCSGMMSAKVELPKKLPIYLKTDVVISKRSYYEQEQLFSSNNIYTVITNREIYTKLRLGLPFLNSSKAEVAVGYGYITDKYFPSNIVDYSNVSMSVSNYSLVMGSVKFEHNTLNNVMFPNKGSALSIIGEFVVGNEEYNPYSTSGEVSTTMRHSWLQLNAYAENYFDIGKKFAIGLVGNAVISSKGLMQSQMSSLIQAPAFTPTPHSEMVFNSGFRANQYLAAGIVPIWNIINKLQLRLDTYAFAPIFEIKDSGDGTPYYGKLFNTVNFMSELAVVYNLPFASISAYGNYYSSPRDDFNFGIAFGILLYNPKFLE